MTNALYSHTLQSFTHQLCSYFCPQKYVGIQHLPHHPHPLLSFVQDAICMKNFNILSGKSSPCFIWLVTLSNRSDIIKHIALQLAFLTAFQGNINTNQYKLRAFYSFYYTHLLCVYIHTVYNIVSYLCVNWQPDKI